MKRIIKISLIFLLVGMAVIVAVPFLKEKEAEKKSDNGFKEIKYQFDWKNIAKTYIKVYTTFYK